MLDEPSEDLRGDTGFLVIVRGGERVVGKASVSEIETLSVQRGLHTLHLTVRDDLAEAHRVYRQLGYQPVPPFSTSPYADHQLAKVLPEFR